MPELLELFTAPPVKVETADGYIMSDGRLASRDANGNDDDLVASGVAVVAKDTGRVLMLQRHHEDASPNAGEWEFPGGHIEDDEGPYEAAAREWMEEVGQSLPKGKRTGYWNAINGKYRGYVYRIAREDMINIHQGEDRKKVNPDDPDGDRIEVVAWFDPSHLRDNPALRPELQEDMHLIEPLIIGAVSELSLELPKDTP